MSDFNDKFKNPNIVGVIAPDRPGTSAQTTTEKPDQNPDTKEKGKKKRNILIGALAGAAMTVTAIVGVNVAANQPPAPTGTTEPGEPIPGQPGDPTEAPVEGPQPVEFTDEQLAELMSEPIPAEMERYDAMSVEEFEALPIEERLSYASWLNRDQDYIAGQFYEAYNDNVRYLLPENVSEESTAQEILTIDTHRITSAMVSHFGGQVYDRDEYQKLLASGFYQPDANNPDYVGWTNNLNENTVVATPKVFAQNGGNQMPTVVAEQPGASIVTPAGETLFSRTITYKTVNGNEYTSTYVLVDYVDYKGQSQQTYVSYAQ